MWKFLLPMAAFIALLVFFAMGLSPSRDLHAIPSPLIGKAAPVFSLPDALSPDKTVGNAQLAGQVYVFNVWATWCVPCRQEHETLLQVSTQKVVPIIGLLWKDEAERGQAWLSQLGNPYTAVALDLKGRTAIDWGVYGAPETYLVDKKGRVIFKYISPLTMDTWTSEFLPRIEAAKREST
jgi:cytochrome c biogenesis protein CcmG, thiol:disulfide interchange protein DsbE